MATRVCEDLRVLKDNGDVCPDATLTFYLADSSTLISVYSDDELTTVVSVLGVVSCDAYGWPPVNLWVADDISTKVVIAGTGVTTRTQNPLTIAMTSAAAAGVTSDFTNFLVNGGFAAWSGLTSFSNISGDGDGDEVADEWFFTQPAAASNAVSRQTANATGARYGLRFGRPVSSTSTNELRVWQMLATDAAYRLRSQEVTVSFTAIAGANFSGTGLSIRLATGTTEGEDGDLIDSSGFGGHSNPIDQTQSITTTATRYQFTATLGATIKEVGLQFSYTGVGTAGANDWAQIEDVQIEIAATAGDFAAVPESLEFLRAGLTAGGRLFVASTFSDPGADRVIFWDDSAGALTGLALDTGLSITGTTLSLAASLAALAGITVSADALLLLADADVPRLGTANSWTSGAQTFAGAIVAAAGSVGATAINFGTANRGFYDTGSAIAVAVAGVLTSFWDASGFHVQSTYRLYSGSGTVSLPGLAFQDDTDNGLYYIGTNNWGAAAGGALQQQWDTGGPKDASGNVLMSTGKHMVPILAAAMVARTTNGAASGSTELATNDVMLISKDFDQTAEEGVQFTIPAPKSWNESTVTFRARWTAASGTGGVAWSLGGLALSDDDAMDQAFGTAQVVTDTLITANDMHITSESSAITIAGTPAEGDTLIFEVRRVVANGSDTLTADAKLIGIDLFLTYTGANDA